MKWKKYEITENKNTVHNFQFTRRVMEISITNRQQKQDHHILKR